MPLDPHSGQKSVGILGGGLAGLAAAVALCGRGLRVELFEARRHLGGRAGSFYDPAADQLVDHCQHVGMGCCTNLLDFCRRTGIDGRFRRDRVLHFFGPDGRRHDVQATAWLPAPLHLAPSLGRLGFLSWAERWGIARALLKLARLPTDDIAQDTTIGAWLRGCGQSQQAIDRFWSVVLVSALGDTVDRASLSAARKVFVDGFMSSRQAYHVLVPTVPLGQLYDRHVAEWLRGQNVAIHLATPVEKLTGDARGITGLHLADAAHREFDYVIVALPWRRVRDVLPDKIAAAAQLPDTDRIEGSPIIGIHLWLDRPITPLPHAVLIGRLAQWIFNRGPRPAPGKPDISGHYYQVVISASHTLSGRDRNEVIKEILDDLQAVWPAARQAQLLHHRIVTQHDAVFSPRPGLDLLRPPQQTPINNLTLAGDWTRTGWPSTMEGAVRSGYLAAENVLCSMGLETRIVVSNQARGRWGRLLLGVQ